MSEWPLVLFTVALQLSCGLALAATILDWQHQPDGAARKLGIAVFPIAVLGLLGSMFHLGRPLAAVRALSNLGSSRLSLETLFTSVFVVSALIYGYCCRNPQRKHRFLMGIVTGLVGLGAIASSVAVYVIPARPAWDSGWVAVSFAGTTLLLAGFGAAGFTELKAQPKLLSTLLAVGVVGSIGSMAAALWMLASLSRDSANDYVLARLSGSLHLVITRYGVWLALYLLLTAIFPFAAALKAWPRKNPEMISSGPYLTRAFAGALVGVIIGRALMYAVGVSFPPF